MEVEAFLPVRLAAVVSFSHISFSFMVLLLRLSLTPFSLDICKDRKF